MYALKFVTDRLIKEGGSLVSTAQLSQEEILKANIENRSYVSDEGFGFVWVPCETLSDKGKITQLEAKVFPSEDQTIVVADADDIYGGAHLYNLLNCIGFHDGKTVYSGGSQTIQFVQKKDDGQIIPGLQSEQLVYVLLDRAIKLNHRFPSPQNEQMIKGLQMFLDACKDRIKYRMERGVMGELKK